MKAPFFALSLAVIGIFALGAASSAISQTTPAAAPAAQTGDPSISANRALGEVKVIDAAAKQLIIKTDAGTLVTVTLSDATSYMRVAPGETTLTKATKITFADVAEGDRVMAMGKVSDDHKLVPARTLIVMTKADIAKKQEADRAEWKRRGILGIVTALKPETKEITISSRFENIELVQVIAEHLCENAGVDEDGSHWIGMAVREAVANAIKHGNKLDIRKKVNATFELSGDELEITISDEGAGFDPATDRENTHSNPCRGSFRHAPFTVDGRRADLPVSMGSKLLRMRRGSAPA